MKRLRWTNQAVEDLTSAREYIAQDNPQAARETVLRLIEAAESLTTHPHMGRPGRHAKTRELVVPNTPFIIPYSVKGEVVEILRVLHGARAWGSL